MTDIQIAEQTIATLTDKRAAATQRASEIAAERQALGYAAHADNDAKARAKLAKLNAEQASLTGEVESIDAAISEGRSRLAAAITAAEQAQARADAKEVRELLRVFVAEAQDADGALADFAESVAAMAEALRRVHGLGVAFPSNQQLLSLGRYCLLTAIGRTPWARDFELLAPNQRRDFGPLCASWAQTIERNHIAAVLGEAAEPEKEVA